MPTGHWQRDPPENLAVPFVVPPGNVLLAGMVALPKMEARPSLDRFIPLPYQGRKGQIRPLPKPRRRLVRKYHLDAHLQFG
jgi:hypothetical protein